MRIRDLMTDRALLRTGGLPHSYDPFAHNDALQEAQVIDLRLDAITATLGIIFEMRTSLQFGEADTGVLLARGLRFFTWNTPLPSIPRRAWSVMGSSFTPADNVCKTNIGLYPENEIEITSESAYFFLGDSKGIGSNIPDYISDDDPSMRSKIASWDSEFALVSASRFQYSM